MFLIVILFFFCMVVGFVKLKTELNKKMEKSIKGLNCDFMNKSKKKDSIKWAELDRPNHILGQGIGSYLCYCKKFSHTGMFTKKEDLCYQY